MPLPFRTERPPYARNWAKIISQKKHYIPLKKLLPIKNLSLLAMDSQLRDWELIQLPHELLTKSEPIGSLVARPGT